MDPTDDPYVGLDLAEAMVICKDDLPAPLVDKATQFVQDWDHAVGHTGEFEPFIARTHELLSQLKAL